MQNNPDTPKKKQPLHITAHNGQPLYYAALAAVHTDIEPGERDGFVIIRAAVHQGLIDIHDRKPLVLIPELARE